MGFYKIFALEGKYLGRSGKKRFHFFELFYLIVLSGSSITLWFKRGLWSPTDMVPKPVGPFAG